MELQDKELFPGKKVSDMMKEAYEQHKKQSEVITAEIQRLLDYIEGTGDAIVIIPIVKDLMNSSLKNDEVLVKLTQIISKSQEPKEKEQTDSSIITEKELLQLLQDVPSLGYTQPTKEQST
jgi:hypothetical protein